MTISNISIGAARGSLIQQLGRMGNRHGLVAGATGTGKTVTLQVLAEGFSRMGVPVLTVDVKGDLSGIAATGQPHPKIDERLAQIPIPNYQQQPFPVVLWDVDGQNGHPVRTTISEMGPLLLSNLLEVNDTQSSVLYAGFNLADDQGLLLLDLKDLRSLLGWMGDHINELGSEYGHISKASLGAIQRRLLVLEEQGYEQFWSEPALHLNDLMHTDFSGRGVISILDVRRVIHNAPRVYSAFLLWLLAELFEQLPEVGDSPAPKMVLFFDEAHMLFDGATKPLLDKIEQVVRLIRSKGVGLYFITQSPLDIPQDVLGQLGMKIQHAMRAFTPKDQKTIKAVSETFVANPEFDTAEVVTALRIGEALVSVLDEEGRPKPVEKTLIAPPESRIGPLSDAERTTIVQRSPLKGRYEQAVDRQSAYEMLKARAEAAEVQDDLLQAEKAAAKKRQQEERTTQSRPKKTSGRRRQTAGEAMIKSAARAIGSQIGRQIIRGILGSIFGRRS